MTRTKWLVALIALVMVVGGLYLGLRKKGSGIEVAGGKQINIKIMSWQGQNPPYWDAYAQLIKDYEAKHPNVKIEHIYQPIWGGGYDKLLNTQFIAGKAPDAALMYGAWLTNFMNQGFLLPLEGYYQQTTPYSHGTRWIDTFVGGENSFTVLRTQNIYGSIPMVNVDGGFGNPVLPFYFNKNILQQAGIQRLPRNWAEFMAVCQKIKAAGYVPIAADNGRWLQWISAFISSQLAPDYYDQFFAEKYHGKDFMGDKVIMSRAQGKVNADSPPVRDVLRILRECAQYWQDGWTGATEQEAQQLFMFGKAAFIMDGNWNYGYYQKNIRGFAWDVMPFPLVTKASSRYAAEALPRGTDQFTYGWGLNRQLSKEPAKLRAVIDFFQYATSKEAQARFTAIAGNIPVNKEVKPGVVAAKFARIPLNRLDETLGSIKDDREPAFAGLLQQFLAGTMAETKFKQEYNTLLLKVSRKLVKDALDPQLGISKTIQTVEAEVKKRERDKNIKPEFLAALRQSLELLRQRLSFYQEYGKGL